MSLYKCECGKEFDAAQRFNGHKSHCKIHLGSVGKLESYGDRQARASATGRKAYNTQLKAYKQQLLDLWIAEQHKCERCGKIMVEKFGSGRFCSRACANSHDYSEETRNKTSASLVALHKANTSVDHKVMVNKNRANYESSPQKCSICGNILPYEKRFRKTCSDECLRIALANAGKISAGIIGKRSKNEIAFCSLCEQYLGKDAVLHNEAMFNGWDADIIIPKYKVAILWNGPWHYRQITKDHSLAQVQIRDKIKLDQIELCGFIPYIIKDNSKFNLNKVNLEFNKFIEYLNKL